MPNESLSQPPGNQQRHDAAAAFYAPLRGEKAGYARVGWESKHAHDIRLAAAIDAVGDVSRLDSIIDAGCGEGALLPPLREAGFTGDYRGEDILGWMIEAARQRHHADTDAEFFVADALDMTGPSADIVICSGTLNTRIDSVHPDAEFAQALRALWERTRRVLVVDVAIADRHAVGARLAAVCPASAMDQARTLSRAWVWREDLIFGEAQLVLWRDRAQTLERVAPSLGPVEHADLLLQAREAEAAKRVLADDTSEASRLLRAIADAQLGRLRDAERHLRHLVAGSSVGDRAALHLAALLRATRRTREAEGLLAKWAQHHGRQGDEARLMLVDMLADREPEAAAAWARAIEDPFVAREAQGRLDA